jgi:hypothetical protein
VARQFDLHCRGEHANEQAMSSRSDQQPRRQPSLDLSRREALVGPNGSDEVLVAVLFVFLVTMPEGIRAGSEIDNGYAPDADTAVTAAVPDSCPLTSHGGGEVGNSDIAVTLPAHGKFIFAPGPRNPGFIAIADGALGQ